MRQRNTLKRWQDYLWGQKMKFLDIIKTASSNMFRSKLRSSLTIIAIFIGAFTLTLTNGIGAGISAYIDDQLGNIGAEDMLIIQSKSDISLDGKPKKYDPEKTVGRSDSSGIPVLNQSDIAKIREQSNLREVEPYLGVTPDFVQGLNQEKYALTISAYMEGLNLDLASGKLPNNKSTENQLVLPLQFVKVLGFSSNNDAVGKTVSIAVTSPSQKQQTVNAKIVGVQEQTIMSGADGANVNSSLINTLHSIQTEGLPESAKNQFITATARVDKNISDEKLETIKSNLDKKGYRALTIEDQIGIIKQVIDAIIVVLNVFAGIALLAASFGIINTLLMAVQERTKEIGLMKAMGMGKSKIFLLFSTEAVLLGFWGSILGTAAAVGIGQIVNQVASDTFLKDLTGFDLTAFPISSLLLVLIIIMAIAFLAGTLPARRAAKQNPIDALRYE